MTGGTSFLIATICTVLIFSGMQMYKPWLISSQVHTIFGGYLGSILFILSLTALGNLETCMFGKSFQVKLFPEGKYLLKLPRPIVRHLFTVLICMLFSILSAAMIHRVCATTCLLLSLCTLYYVNKYSQKVHTQASAPAPQISKKKK